MLRSLAGRTLITVGLVVTGFVVVCFLMLYTGIKDLIARDSILHATNLADTIVKSTHYAMLKSDRETLAAIINNVGAQKEVDHVRIFNKAGVINASSNQYEIGRIIDKKTEGCVACHMSAIPATRLGRMEQARKFRNKAGVDIVAITAPIYNEPQCSNAACHFHPPTQKVLGTLDIGLSQETMLATLTSIRYQMIAFTAMILILTAGGVTALLRRSVFLPMRKLSDLAEEADSDEGITSPSTRFPNELDRIADSYYKLTQKLRQTQVELLTTRQETASRDQGTELSAFK
jgi:methyl-accepting chemotaxis protein